MSSSVRIEISEKAISCPKCAFPLNSNTNEIKGLSNKESQKSKEIKKKKLNQIPDA